MTIDFEELDYQNTPLGEISLRRRAESKLEGEILYEVKLGEEFLMSSRFTSAEIQLARLGLAAFTREEMESNAIYLSFRPTEKNSLPSEAFLTWHNENVFKS